MKDKTKRTLSTAAVFALTLAAIIFFNIIIGLAADKLPLRWDLTENKLYALTDETKAVLSSLKEEVTLYYFASPGHEQEKIVRTLDMYRTGSDKLSIVQCDPNADPIAARRFTDKGIAIQQNTIVLERGTRFRAISPSEMYSGYTTQSGQTLDGAFFGLEQLITRAVAYVATDVTKNVCFTVGHNEIDYSGVLKELQSENIATYQIDLKTDDIPDTVDAVYIMAPAEDFTKEELLRLDAFLAKGKGAHIAFDARRKALPRLEEYLKAFWGVTMYHDLVCEGDSSRTLNYSYMFVPDLLEHPITEDIRLGNQRTVFMYARSLSVEEAEYVTPQILAQTTKSAFSVHGSDRNVTENIREGVLPLSVALSKKTMDGSVESRLVVSGSYQLYDSFFTAEGSLANRSLLFRTAQYVTFEDISALSISPKSLLTRSLLISDGLTVFYIIAVCILPPLFCFVLGVIIFRRRRHL